MTVGFVCSALGLGFEEGVEFGVEFGRSGCFLVEDCVSLSMVEVYFWRFICVFFWRWWGSLFGG